MKLRRNHIFLGLLLLSVASCSDSAQKADPDFIPKNTQNSFSGLTSPVVLIDEAHHNFHTTQGRYKPFSQVLSSDGYTVEPGKEKFTLEYLQQAEILVIANALDKNRRDYNPPYGNAFETEEIEALMQWISQGGSLFLVADHTPFPKVIETLSSALGVQFSNGHVGNAIFRINDNTLVDHVITNGNSIKNVLSLDNYTSPILQGKPNSERIVQVKTFGGSAFKAPETAKSLLVLSNTAVSVMPDIPFQVNAETPRLAIPRWSQGAVLEIGKGRVAVFAEGMMFSSQLTVKTGKKYGLLSKGAEQNEQFLLNVMHWLSGLI
jgi:hypothetical protein